MHIPPIQQSAAMITIPKSWGQQTRDCEDKWSKRRTSAVSFCSVQTFCLLFQSRLTNNGSMWRCTVRYVRTVRMRASGGRPWVSDPHVRRTHRTEQRTYLLMVRTFGPRTSSKRMGTLSNANSMFPVESAQINRLHHSRFSGQRYVQYWAFGMSEWLFLLLS